MTCSRPLRPGGLSLGLGLGAIAAFPAAGRSGPKAPQGRRSLANRVRPIDPVVCSSQPSHIASSNRRRIHRRGEWSISISGGCRSGDSETVKDRTGPKATALAEAALSKALADVNASGAAMSAVSPIPYCGPFSLSSWFFPTADHVHKRYPEQIRFQAETWRRERLRHEEPGRVHWSGPRYTRPS